MYIYLKTSYFCCQWTIFVPEMYVFCCMWTFCVSENTCVLMSMDKV